MAPRLHAPCLAVDSGAAEITLAPASPGQVRASTAREGIELETPLRMQPLADALNSLIDGLARQASAAAGTSSDVKGVAPTLLLDLLSTRHHPVPALFRTHSGVELLVDGEYYNAWLTTPLTALAPTLGDEPVTHVAAVALEDFKTRTARGNGMQPIQLEQLFWLTTGTTQARRLAPWLDDMTTPLRLKTWPNLSAQADYLQWLDVLPMLWQTPMAMTEVIHRLQAAGIPAHRARQGMALLRMFRHARRVLHDGGNDPASRPAPSLTPDVRQARPQRGLLDRLKKRLRNVLH